VARLEAHVKVPAGSKHDVSNVHKDGCISLFDKGLDALGLVRNLLGHTRVRVTQVRKLVVHVIVGDVVSAKVDIDHVKGAGCPVDHDAGQQAVADHHRGEMQLVHHEDTAAPTLVHLEIDVFAVLAIDPVEALLVH